MSTMHTVEQGDHIEAIAAEYGFGDYHTIWDHPQNAELKQKRKNPGVLMPGDRVFIPDKEEKTVTAPSGRKAKFKLHRTIPRVRLKVRDFLGQPLANAQCELTLGGQSQTLTTDGDGLLDAVLPDGALDGTLRFPGGEIALRVGALDPIEEKSGLIARLRNLGYLVDTEPEEDVGAAETDPDAVDPDELQFAIELFQKDQDLTVDGQASQALLDKLREIHGC